MLSMACFIVQGRRLTVNAYIQSFVNLSSQSGHAISAMLWQCLWRRAVVVGPVGLV